MLLFTTRKSHRNSQIELETTEANITALEQKASKANAKLADNVSNTTTQEQMNAYGSADTVFSCVSYAADICSQVKLNFYTKKGNEKVPLKDKKLLDWVAQPNPFISFPELISVYIQSYLLGGNAYITFEKVGGTYESWILDPTKTKVVPDPKKYISGYTFDDTVAYKPNEVITFRNLTPNNIYYGQSYLASLVDMLAIEGYSVDDLKSMYSNSLIFQGIFTSEYPLTDKQITALRAQFNSLYGQGGGQRYGHLIAPNNLKFQPLKGNPKDAMLIESLGISEDRVYKVFRTPKALLGDATKSNGTDLKELKKIYVNNFIRPLLNKMIGQWQTFFRRILKDNTLIIETDYSNIPEVSDAFETRIDAVQKALSAGIISPNEARDKLNLEVMQNANLMDSIFSPAYLLGQNPVDLITGNRIDFAGQENQ